jgi:hypothetical protein
MGQAAEEMDGLDIDATYMMDREKIHHAKAQRSLREQGLVVIVMMQNDAGYIKLRLPHCQRTRSIVYLLTRMNYVPVLLRDVKLNGVVPSTQ